MSTSIAQKMSQCPVTVFILTVGDPAFPVCEQAIKRQTFTNFHLEIIRNVSPFNKSAQEMINRSQTKYFIQVDEDMILEPHAVGTMVQTMEELPEDIAMLVFHLWDEDREKRIQGVKIYRTEHMKKVEWQDGRQSIMKVMEQFMDFGARWVLHQDIVGKHGVLYTPETIYRRYKTMYEKDIAIFNRVADDIYRKAHKFRKTGDPLSIFALLGSAHGIIQSKAYQDKEKDYTQYNLEALDVFKRLFLQPKPHSSKQDYNPNKQFALKHQTVPYDQLKPSKKDPSVLPPPECLVTVFILTVGDPAFLSCVQAVTNQSYNHFRLEIIRNVSPFSKAAQEMINRSSTKYFIQVDEDMILEPDAVGKMVQTMEELPEDIAMLCFHLWDEDRQRRIQGIKIYRTQHLKKVKWRDLKASEQDLLDQFSDIGVRWVLHEEIVGKHGVVYTPKTIYLRYKDMYERDLTYFNRVFDDIYKKALKFKETGDMLPLFALLGAAHGIINAQTYQDKEKDYTQYHNEALDLFVRLFLQPAPPPKEQIYKKDQTFVLKHRAVHYNDPKKKRK